MIPLLGLALLGGCTVESWRNADLQIDVHASTLGDEDRVRICVADVGIREIALGSGLAAFPGLPANGSVDVTIDALDTDTQAASEDTAKDTAENTGSGDNALRRGRAGPIVLDTDARYSSTAWRPCQADHEDCALCEASGELASDDEASWLLAVRFLD